MVGSRRDLNAALDSQTKGDFVGEIIAAINVEKQFKGQPLLSDVNLRVKRGQSYALTGPNGAGKSVLLKLMCRFLAPSSGSIAIDPSYLSANRTFPEKFGVSINGPAFLGHQSAMENLRALARIRGRIGDNEIRDALDKVGLVVNDRQRVASFSTGMKQKFALAQAIMESPEVLILDEPFNGLDAASVERIHSLLAEFISAGGTLIYTSHLSGDVDRLATAHWSIDNRTVITH
jgi:ABC-2 type transport system ATP-binding protein